MGKIILNNTKEIPCDVTKFYSTYFINFIFRGEKTLLKLYQLLDDQYYGECYIKNEFIYLKVSLKSDLFRGYWVGTPLSFSVKIQIS